MNKFLILTAAVFYCNSLAAQSFDEIKQFYPDKLAVFSKLDRSVEIEFQKGIPVAESKEVTEMMILDDRANGLFNKDEIHHSGFNELKKIEAYTLQPDGKSYKKLKVTEFKTQSSKSNSIFYDDVKETVFHYPQVKAGNISHVETVHYNKDIRFLSPFYFNNYLPVAEANFSITYPADIQLKFLIKNDPSGRVKVKETTSGKRKKIEFSGTNLPYYQHYSDATSFSYYATHVIAYVVSYKSGSKETEIFNSPDQLYKWNVGFLHNINKEPSLQLKKLTDSLCEGKKTEYEKAMAIFNWVQSNIKYVAFEEGLEGFIPRQAADVYRKLYGDCKDMASILTEMMKQAGIKAYFTWIGTRSIPYSYTEVPLPVTDNHMICAIEIDKQWIFLDATDPNCIFGFPSSGIQNKEALVSINDTEYKIVKVPVVNAGKNNITDSTFLTIKDNKLNGECKVSYSGYFGNDLYNSLMYAKGKDEEVYVKRRMGKGSNKFILNDYKINLENKANRSANISAKFEIADYAKSIGDDIYINLNLEKLLEPNYIDTVKRVMAIENEYVYTIEQAHILNIPSQYALDYVPENTHVSNDLVDFSIEYKKKDGVITSLQKLTMKKLYIEPSDFATWNKTISLISPAYKEQIVLKKK